MFFLLNISDNRDAKSLADSGSISNSQQELLLQRKEDDENDMNGFDDGQIDMKHYKSNISWVVLDDYTVEGSAGIESKTFHCRFIPFSIAYQTVYLVSGLFWSFPH